MAQVKGSNVQVLLLHTKAGPSAQLDEIVLVPRCTRGRARSSEPPSPKTSCLLRRVANRRRRGRPNSRSCNSLDTCASALRFQPHRCALRHTGLAVRFDRENIDWRLACRWSTHTSHVQWTTAAAHCAAPPEPCSGCCFGQRCLPEQRTKDSIEPPGPIDFRPPCAVLWQVAAHVGIFNRIPGRRRTDGAHNNTVRSTARFGSTPSQPTVIERSDPNEAHLCAVDRVRLRTLGVVGAP